MISTGFGYGERSKIADAYAKMYAPKSLMNESCDCGNGGCECGAKKKTVGSAAIKHKIPSKTGSKLGTKKVLPFKKRDAKPSAKKFTPKVKKVSESTKYFCIADGDRVLCTNDIGESYFNKGGTCGEMRIYESKISAMKDISKVKSRRNPNSKYKVRACECIGESVQFADAASSHPVNEGLWDGIKSIGGGLWDATKGVGNVVGGVAKGAGNLLQGNFSQAAKDVGGGVVDGLKGIGSGVGGVVSGAAEGTLGTVRDLANAGQSVMNAAGNAVQGDFGQAKENLLGAQSAAQGAVADGAREADTAGAIMNGAKAVGNAALQGAKAVGNTALAGGNVAGGALKSVGNALQGNFKQAGQDLTGGLSAAGQNMADAGKNVVNAATNSNGSQQQQNPNQSVPKGLSSPNVATNNTPPSKEQNLALAAGHGPVSQQRAEELQSVAPKLGMQKFSDSMMNYLNQQQQQQGQQGAQQQGQQQQQQQQGAQQQQGQQGAQQNNSARKAELQQKIAELQKELASLG